MSDFAAAAGRLAGLAGMLLGWTPDIFWAATPAELACVIRALSPQAAEPASRDEIARLLEAYPDG